MMMFPRIYLAKRKSQIKPAYIDHYGVIVFAPFGAASLIHLTEQGIRKEVLGDLPEWTLLFEVPSDQIGNAELRLREALRNPFYHLFWNNCEQFARYVATGAKESTQLHVVGMLAVGVFAVAAISERL
jgi:hypothetical protein